MGIDVWRLRGHPAAAEASVQEVAVEAVAGPDIRDDETGRSGSPANPAMDRQPVQPAEDGRQIPPKRDRPADGKPSRSPAVAPFAVLSLTKAGARLIVCSDENRAVRRFAADLLAAATGVWGGRSRLLRFDWPQPGIENTQSTLQRALTAFVERQLAESPDDGICLVSSDVLDRVDQARLPEGFLVLPPVGELMSSAELKRTVWKSIRAHIGS